ncbi:MAG: class I SAM-dependent methyltransferase [Flavobacteriales bacterium]|nr:class I SAM-dependent methyltransferase [Flavobacteriales bacterium]
MNFWDERYSGAEYAYGKEPNEFFSGYIAQLIPGKAIFPAEGEGRNAVHAASLGWDVHAFDTSIMGRTKALDLAEELGVRISYEILGYEQFTGNGDYDLVVAIFNHMPPQIRANVHKQYIKALKPGGILLLEAFAPNQMPLQSGGPKDPDMLYTSAMLRQDFNELELISLTETSRMLNEGPYHSGKAELIQYVGRK